MYIFPVFPSLVKKPPSGGSTGNRDKRERMMLQFGELFPMTYRDAHKSSGFETRRWVSSSSCSVFYSSATIICMYPLSYRTTIQLYVYRAVSFPPHHFSGKMVETRCSISLRYPYFSFESYHNSPFFLLSSAVLP